MAVPLEIDPVTCGGGRPFRALVGPSRALVSFSPGMFETLGQLEVTAVHAVTVLLVGETGAGKSYLAELVHELSPRRVQRCVSVACGSMPAEMLESDLFGQVRRRPAGIEGGEPGRLAAADQGTLVLDEIDVLTPRLQTKLLRFLETGQYEPVGSHEACVSRARLVVTSQVPLERPVQQGKFRRDLYFRLSGMGFYLPPLRQRPWDTEYLARKFASEYSRAHAIELRHIAPEVLSLLRRHSWPGNIRELENVIRRAVLSCSHGVLSPDDLPGSIRLGDAVRPPICIPAADPEVKDGSATTLTLEERVDELERQVIEESLRRHNFHRIQTAQELGISRVTLYNKMKKFGMFRAGAAAGPVCRTGPGGR